MTFNCPFHVTYELRKALNGAKLQPVCIFYCLLSSDKIGHRVVLLVQNRSFLPHVENGSGSGDKYTNSDKEDVIHVCGGIFPVALLHR